MSKNNKKVLYFASSAVFGGAERFLENILLESSDPNIFFLNDGPFFERCKRHNFHTYLNSFNTKLSNPFTWLRFQIFFYSFLRKNQFTHIHLTMAYSQVFAALASRLAGVQIIWFQHGPIGGVIDKVGNLLPYDKVLFNSEYTKSEHVKKAGKLKSRDYIFPLKVSTSFEVENVKKIQEKYSKNLFVSYGRIASLKSYETAILALSKINKDWSLLIIGEASSDEEKDYFLFLKDLVKKNYLEEKVHFLGFKENVYDYVRAASAVIQTSKTPEAFGLVVAEAISLETFVMALKHGGVIGQVTDDYQGVLIDIDRPVENLLHQLEKNWHKFDGFAVSKEEPVKPENKSMYMDLDQIYKL